jgi:hypothetical protein
MNRCANENVKGLRAAETANIWFSSHYDRFARLSDFLPGLLHDFAGAVAI